MTRSTITADDSRQFAQKIKHWGKSLGFDQVGISDIKLEDAEDKLEQWLGKNFHGSMHYMAKHGLKRTRAQLLVPNTVSIISVRMEYYPDKSRDAFEVLNDKELAYISRYALGRDYHKVLRKRLQQFATQIEHETGPYGYRVFVDSAPVMEKAIAEKAGLGWIGKHSNLLNKNTGSWFFLGEIYVDIPLPADEPLTSHCGKCTACIDDCPTQAIVAPYTVDARRCISYLTIENQGTIPIEFRKAMGNRIYGCDDCQLVCPWNRFSEPSTVEDFSIRHNLDSASLLALFKWDEATFLKKTEGSPIRRIGYERWTRNLAVALGNSIFSEDLIKQLNTKLINSTPMVVEHIEWALRQHNRLPFYM